MCHSGSIWLWFNNIVLFHVLSFDFYKATINVRGVFKKFVYLRCNLKNTIHHNMENLLNDNRRGCTYLRDHNRIYKQTDTHTYGKRDKQIDIRYMKSKTHTHTHIIYIYTNTHARTHSHTRTRARVHMDIHDLSHTDSLTFKTGDLIFPSIKPCPFRFY